jgi:diacylglycerol O-acyltransferase / wax synthase
MPSMNLLEATMLVTETADAPMHVGGLQIFRLPHGAPADYMRRLYDEAIATQPVPGMFRVRAVERPRALPVWEPMDTVRMHDHVWRHALPAPGGIAELFELVTRLNEPLMNRTRPLWDCHFIEGLPHRCFAVFSRVHHALIDGAGGMRMMKLTMSEDARERGLKPFWAVDLNPQAARPAPSAPAGWWERLRQTDTRQRQARRQVQETLSQLYAAYRHPEDGELTPYYRAPYTRLNGELTPRRSFAIQTLPLPGVKALARAHDATVNEIVLALCAGALRSWLAAHDQIPEQPLVASVPVALKRGDDAVAGNAVGNAAVSLATHLADPAARLQAIRGASRHAKALVRELSTPAANALAVISGLPFVVAKILGQQDRMPPINVVISNVPGPARPLYVNGAQLLAEYPLSVLLPNQALNITVISYAEELHFGLLACPDNVPQLDELALALGSAFDELRHATAPSGPAP